MQAFFKIFSVHRYYKSVTVLISIFLMVYALPLKGLIAEDFLISRNVIHEIDLKYGLDASKRVETMNNLLQTIHKAPIKDQLERVNAFFNRVTFTSDQEQWHQEDHWSTPLEFLGTNKGDCEDYVIAKFFTLLKLGIPKEKLYFTYVTYLKSNQAHMVLTYVETPKSMPLVLDNINKEILLASQRHDLRHVYSFNAESLYLNKQKSLGQIVPSGLKKNRKWVEFLSRVTMDQL